MRHRCRKLGFSFAEMMFAVVILGIGFILVAAIFPVAIRQSISTADESNAAQFAREVAGTIATATHGNDYPDDASDVGVTVPFAKASAGTSLYDEIAASLVSSSDPRYAAVPYFCRLGTDGTIRVTIVVVRRVIRPIYSAADLAPNSGNPNDLGGELVPRLVTLLGIRPGSNGLPTVEVAKDPGGNFAAAAPGAYLVVTSSNADVAGKSLRLGEIASESSASQIWSLLPGAAVTAEDDYSNVSAAVIGREPVDPKNMAAGFLGPAQDVALYTTFIRPN